MKKNYVKKTLKNGVKLYLYIDSNMRKYYIDYAVDYGSSGKYFKFYYKDKLYKVLPGIAHFLEHMLGEHSKYGNLYKIFSDKKYQNNASTFNEMTHYYFYGTDDIKESIKMLINAIDDPVFTKDDVEKTKPAIIEETKNELNDKYQICTALGLKNLYLDVDLYHESLSQIGNEETTKKLDYNTLKLCYDAFYYDDNKTLLIAGNFDEKEMTDYIESIYNQLKPHKKELKEYEYQNLDKVKTKEEIKYLSTSEDLVSIIFKQTNKNNYSRREIATYLNFISYTKLLEESKFIEKLKKEGIISYIGARWHTFFDNNHFNILIGANVKQIDKYIEELINELNINNFNKRDFELYMKTKISKEAAKIDFKYDVFSNFQIERAYTDDFDDIEFFKSLTFESFLEFYNTLNFNNYTISIIRDESKKVID